MMSHVDKLLLGRVALVAQRPIVVKLSPSTICRSVRTCLRACVGRSVQCTVENTADRIWNLDAVWHRRSDGSSHEADSAVWGSVHGNGYFWERIWGAIVTNGDFTAYVCDCAATRPSSQITLGKLMASLKCFA